MTFWLRRCAEQSRSPSASTLACAVTEDLHFDVPGVLDRVRKQRHAQFRRQFSGRVGRAKCAHLRRRRADERYAGVFARFGEIRILAQESVAGMNRLRTRFPGGFEKAIDYQIALRRRRRPDRDGLVGARHMRRVAVGFGVNSDRADAHLAKCPEDAASDHSAVRNKNFPEHQASVSRIMAPPSSNDTSPLGKRLLPVHHCLCFRGFLGAWRAATDHTHTMPDRRRQVQENYLMTRITISAREPAESRLRPKLATHSALLAFEEERVGVLENRGDQHREERG